LPYRSKYTKKKGGVVVDWKKRRIKKPLAFFKKKKFCKLVAEPTLSDKREFKRNLSNGVGKVIT
jgi:hypothetical protein